MKQLGLIIAIFSLGYYLGHRNSPEALHLKQVKTTEILKCRDEVKELKSQCNVSEINSKANSQQDQNTPESQDAQGLIESESRKNSHRASEIAFEADKKEFLKKVEVKNLFEELKTAKIVGEDQLKVLNGFFTGQVEFDETDRPNWDMELRLNGQVLNEEARGDKLISLFKNGKLFARTTGKGRIKGVLSMSDDPNSFIVEVNGDEGYVQIYYFPRLDEFSGIYYQKVSVGQFEREGTVTLKRSFNSASF